MFGKYEFVLRIAFQPDDGKYFGRRYVNYLVNGDDEKDAFENAVEAFKPVLKENVKIILDSVISKKEN